MGSNLGAYVKNLGARLKIPPLEMCDHMSITAHDGNPLLSFCAIRAFARQSPICITSFLSVPDHVAQRMLVHSGNTHLFALLLPVVAMPFLPLPVHPERLRCF